MYEFVFHPSIVFELEDSIKWYESKTFKVAEDFKTEIKKSFLSLKSNPFLFQKISINYRAYSIKKFPFRIIYSIEDNIIYVLSVFHTSKNPEIWKNRKFK